MRLSGLVLADERRTNGEALSDFAAHGVPFAFPPIIGPATVGVPTAHSSVPFEQLLESPDKFVWPHESGSIRGQSLMPLFPGAPALFGRNQPLYELLAIVDALRVGTTRVKKNRRRITHRPPVRPQDVTGTANPISRTADRVAIVARAIEPILNRVVLGGPSVTQLLVDDPAVRVPDLTFTADATLQLLSTSMIDRLGADLQKAGLARTGRTENTDRWRTIDGIEFDLVQVRTDDAQSGEPWLEYATLLTIPHAVDDRIAMRIAGAPSVLALELVAFGTEWHAPRLLESDELERVVQLTAGRVEIEKECATAPPELRAFIVQWFARLTHNDSLQLLIQRALPDAAILPALARRVRRRILRIAV